MSLASSKLGGMVKDQREKLASSVKLLLLWMAASDGQLDDTELEFASSKLPDSDAAATTEELLEVIRSGDVASMEMAIRTVAQESRELRIALMDLGISMSMADRRIAITENHILRFYADALFLGPEMLEKRFQAMTGAPLAEPGDPGDPAWWGELARAGELPPLEARAGDGMTAEQARSVLSVDAEAGPDEIDRAYRNQSAISQLERVEAMDETVVAAANARLAEIERAYALLRS
jgi:uncharacterized tellurite resistance protein B-like protein